MSKYTNKEYKIFENIAQAKSILRKNDGSIEDDDFLKIVDATEKNGWTGLLTRLVYHDKVDVDEVIGFYPDLKNSKLDLGKLNKMSYTDIVDHLYDNGDISTDEDIVFIGRVKDQLIFHVKSYESGLNIISPAWCLKTRFHWDRYTNENLQFVSVDAKYINKSGKIKLLTPNSDSYFGSYGNKKNPKVRYGITYNPRNRSVIEIFNDNNINVSESKITDIIFHIKKYCSDNNYNSFKKIKDDYDNLSEFILSVIKEIETQKISWDNSIYFFGNNRDSNFAGKYKELKSRLEHHDVYIEEFYDSYKEEIEDDEEFVSHSGFMDYIVYKLEGEKNHDEGGHPLSGNFLREREDYDHSFKYIYGFSQNHYGVLYIKQSYDNVSQWYEYLLKNFTRVFMNVDLSQFGHSIYNDSEFLSFLNDKISINDMGTGDNINPIIDLFFGGKIHKDALSVGVQFYSELFFNIVKSWVEIKRKISTDEDYRYDILGGNSINYEVLTEDISKIIDNKDSDIKYVILLFLEQIHDECYFVEYPGMNKFNEFTESDVVDIFKKLFSFADGFTKIEELTDKNGVKSIAIKMYYQAF